MMVLVVQCVQCSAMCRISGLCTKHVYSLLHNTGLHTLEARAYSLLVDILPL